MNNVSRTICLLKNLEIADNKTVELCVIELTSSFVQLKVSRVLVPGVGSESALLMDNTLFFFIPWAGTFWNSQLANSRQIYMTYMVSLFSTCEDVARPQ